MEKCRELKVEDGIPENLVTDGDLFLIDGKSEYVLLPAGVFVPPVLLEQLKAWKIKTVSTVGQGQFYEKEHLSQKVSLVSLDHNEEHHIEEIKSLYVQFSETISEIFEDYKESQEILVSHVTDLLHEIIQVLRDRRRFLIRLNLYDGLCSNYFVSHALQTTILSFLIGDSLKLPPHRLIDVGIVALLHDIGFFHLPSHLYKSEEQLTPEEQRLFSSHVAVGYKNLKPFSFSPDVLLGVLQHHEYMDGTGYLQGLSGDQISLGARIIGLTSFYHEQISDRPYREGKTGYSVLASFVKDMKQKYDESLVSHLISSLSLFPIGSRVKLSDGSEGVVVDTDPEDIRYPVVKITTDSDGSRMSVETSAVKLDNELFVTSVFR